MSVVGMQVGVSLSPAPQRAPASDLPPWLHLWLLAPPLLPETWCQLARPGDISVAGDTTGPCSRPTPLTSNIIGYPFGLSLHSDSGAELPFWNLSNYVLNHSRFTLDRQG
eukprot:sb/3477262/